MVSATSVVNGAGRLVAKRNHHTNPRMYLKGFSLPEKPSHVYVYTQGAAFAPRGDRNGRNPRCHPLRKAAVVRDAYAFPETDGSANYESVENKLERIESRNNPILAKLRTQKTISDKEKQSFSEYVGSMVKRVNVLDPAFPARVEKMVDSVDWEELQRQLQFAGHFRQAYEIASGRDEKLAWLKEAVHKNSIVEPMPRVEAALSKMTWRILVTPPENFFVTSDNPVVFDRGAGIEPPAGVLWFPVSSDVAIQAEWRPGEDLQYSVCAEETVTQLNQAACALAFREVYASHCSEELHAQLEKSRSSPESQ